MNKLNKIFLELLPVLICLLILIFVHTELIIIVLVFLATLFTLIRKYEKNEIYLFLFGMIIGIFFELFGNLVLGQSWAQASFFKIPIWLPLTWAYGFILIRRIGNIIV